MKNFLLPVLIVLLLSACVGVPTATEGGKAKDYVDVANPRFENIRLADNKFEKDRQAVLAFQGDYRVNFHFEETVVLIDGYSRHEPKNAGAYELVFAVEDRPHQIVLQHLLVMPGGHVVKHWRQDWTYEAKERFEFIADQSWAVRPLDFQKTAGTWTQCVYEVSDAPRYCGTGKWNHRYGVSTWTSDRSWRPLPRREYTKRDDYNALNVENRHTITPSGWTHEQDNTKTVRNGRETSKTLVREYGFNDYRNIRGYDFSPGHDYWAKTSAYWALVRTAWRKRLDSGKVLRLKTEVDGMPIIKGTFEQAEEVNAMSSARQNMDIEALLNEWTELISTTVQNTELENNVGQEKQPSAPAGTSLESTINAY